jgi:hypothetical protein
MCLRTHFNSYYIMVNLGLQPETAERGVEGAELLTKRDPREQMTVLSKSRSVHYNEARSRL